MTRERSSNGVPSSDPLSRVPRKVPSGPLGTLNSELGIEILPARWEGPGCFDGVRVVEIGDEKGEFCGKLLAGDGAEVIKIEPPGGGRSRRIGPFYEDTPGPERSLFFWH